MRKFRKILIKSGKVLETLTNPKQQVAVLTEVAGFLGFNLVVGELDPVGCLRVLLLLQRVVQHGFVVAALGVLPTKTVP